MAKNIEYGKEQKTEYRVGNSKKLNNARREKPNGGNKLSMPNTKKNNKPEQKVQQEDQKGSFR